MKMLQNIFLLFSISLKDDAWHQTSGSFWTARSYAKLGRYDDINFWLKEHQIIRIVFMEC